MTPLPTGKQFFQRWLLVSGANSLGSVVLIALYLWALLRMPPDQVVGFQRILLGAFVFLWVTSNVASKRLFRPLLEVLDARAAGGLEAAQATTGFAEAANLPARSFVMGALFWGFGGFACSTAMRVWFGESFPWLSWLVMVAAATSGGFVSMVFNFYMLKRLNAPIRETLAAQVGDPERRGALVRPIPLGRKLLVAMAGVMVVTLGFAMLMAHVRASLALEEFANRVHVLLLERGAAELAAQGELVQPDAQAGGEVAVLGARLVLLDAQARDVLAGPTDALLAGELTAIRLLDVDAGDSSAFDTPSAFAWRRLPDNLGILVAVSPPRAVAGAAGSRAWVVLLVFALFSIVLAVWIARLAARDVADVTGPLVEEVARVARGDLTQGRTLESEDELGALARHVERMATALHQTVGRVVEAVHGVEQAASEIAAVSDDLGHVTSDQVQGIDQVATSMDRIRGEVRGIADSAHGLSLSVEESSSSMLELGVTSDQLNQNAAALSERVSEVSSSLDQMMRSARQVLASIEELASASAETSSSIEEMAASMREVDANAAETARLSSHVVEIADSGRRQVEQTIRGMQAIQEATDTARGVIHGLGERAQEIGTILTVIDDVADETNLLALNAAIIAAQAGEHGRAFSVVADEIKDLADKVLASTKEIGGLIRAVQEEVANAVGAIEGGARSVESGVELSAEAGIALERINTAARESGERIAQIVFAVQEQSKAAAHVVTLMDRVRDGAERIRSAGTEQTQGNEFVLRNASAMSEVAQQVSGAAEEQARGAQRMRETIESVRSAVEQINHSLQGQSAACQQIAELLERVHARTRSNEESAQRMRGAMRGLLQQAEGLREGVRHFRV